ncbi:hypothetical protein HDU67_005378 [Dinochytrium kinnereticum]|nr:hypothetical protein HDU67_005378 [Dinochytrium kinnereticum]
MASCKTFDANTPCGPLFAGLSYVIDSDIGSVLRTVNQSDVVFGSLTDPSKYGCTSSPELLAALADLRYQTSFFCIRFSYLATVAGCPPNPYPAQNFLCPEQATFAVNSFRDVITNPALCPNVNLEDASSYSGTIFGQFQAVLDAINAGAVPGQCFPGIPEETDLAGFSNFNNAVSGCQKNGDELCASFLTANGLGATPSQPGAPVDPASNPVPNAPPASTTRVNAAPPSSSTNRGLVTTTTTTGLSPSQSAVGSDGAAAASSNSSMPVIIGGSLGAVVLVVVAVVVGIMLVRRRGAGHGKLVAPQSPYGAAGGSSGEKKHRINLNSSAPPTPPIPVAVAPKGDIGGFSAQQQGMMSVPYQPPQQQQQQQQQYQQPQQQQQQQYQQPQQQQQQYGYANERQMPSPVSPSAAYPSYAQPPQQPSPSAQFTSTPAPLVNPALAAVAATEGVVLAGATNQPRDSYATPPPSGSSESVMRIIHPYNPTLADELQLAVGQDIIVLRSFDDGWGLGMNPTTGAQGAFPLVCVVRHDELSRLSMAPSEASGAGSHRDQDRPTSAAAAVPKRFSKRVSSAVFTADQMSALAANGAAQKSGHDAAPMYQPPMTPSEEYLRRNGYDPALDDGLPSALPTGQSSAGYPSFVGTPSMVFDPKMQRGVAPPVPSVPEGYAATTVVGPNGTLRKGVTFSEGQNSMHVYPVRDSMGSSVVGSANR